LNPSFTDGIPGVVMSIHSFGNYPEKFHPHKVPVFAKSPSETMA